MKQLMFWVLMSGSALAMAGAQECPSELNGFLLGQHRATLSAMGKPLQTGSHNGWTFEAFQIQSAYIVFEFSPDHHNQIAAIQVTGEMVGMVPFLGVKLGNTEQELIAQLGKPSRVTQEADAGLQLLAYENRNYTFEIDEKKRISSIRIVNECPHDAKGLPAIAELRTALLEHNINELLQLLAGDVEFYKSGKTYSFTYGARQELESGTTEFSQLLYGQEKSLLTLFRDERVEPDQQLRVYEKAPPGSVAKFPDSKVVKEIVYKFEAGRWKVWEVTFR